MSSAPTRPVEVPPYQLQVLVDSVLDDFAEIIGASGDPHNPPTQVKCVQALGRDLYVGCANGRLMRFALQEHPHRSKPAGYRFVSQHTMPGNKPVDDIALAPTVQKILVQSDSRLYFFVYPGMEPVPTSLINPIRLVVTFAVDAGPPDVHPPSVRFVVVKRTGMSLYTLRERLFHEKEGQLQGARTAKRYGRHLCVSNAEGNYCVVNLETLNMIEMIPSSQDGVTVVKPSITVIGENEFLVLSWLGANSGGAVGLFMTGDADPVRGTMQWQEYPVAICVDYPYIVTLLPNRTIEVHNLLTLEIVQVISPPVPSPVFLDPRALAGSAGFSVPSSHRIEKLSPTPLLIVPPLAPSPPSNGKHELEAEPTGSGLTPPPTPRHPDTAGANDSSRAPAYTRSGVVVLGPNGLQSLVPTTLISQADALLESNRLEDAIELAAQTEQAQRRQSRNMAGVEDDTAEELRYVYQRIGYACLLATRFEEAGNYLFRGNLDPRMLVRHFPDLRPSPLLVPPDAMLDAYSGIADRIRHIGSVEEIIATNLVMNYSPHLEADDSALVKLKEVLTQNARTMLQTFLRKSRNRRLFEPAGANRDVSKVVDTLLLRLLAETGDMQEMATLVEEADDTLVLPDVVPVLTHYQRFAVLARIYERRRETGKLLDLLANLVENKWTSETMPDPMGRLLRVLEESRDRALLQKWGLWLVKRDAERGINVLMAARDVNKRGLPKGIAENADATLLRQIREASPEAADQYLEYLVLQKRSTDAALHTQLAERYVAEVLGLLDNEVVRHEFELAVSSYLESARTVPFLAHVGSETPDTDGKRARFKLALFLQGSSLFDVAAVQGQLETRSDILAFECAILKGKLGEHRAALEILASKLRDASSAEAYCSLNGIVIPPRLASSIAERAGLQAWAALISGPKPAARRPTLRAPAAGAGSQEAEEDGQQHELVKILMQVYMTSGSGAYDHTAKLLNAQAVHLDVVDVMSEVPSKWPIAKLSSFLSRSLRRTLHARHEGMIIKAIAAGQNLEATDAAYVHTLAQGALIEEANPHGDEEEIKDEIVEKVTEKTDHAADNEVHEFHADDLS